jgi:hypothetical protein
VLCPGRNVPRALTARGWFADGELVLDIEGPFHGEHDRYLLTVREGRVFNPRTMSGIVSILLPRACPAARLRRARPAVVWLRREWVRRPFRA